MALFSFVRVFMVKSYGRPLEEIPPYEIQYFYDECEKYGIDPDDVKTPIANY